MLVRMERRPPVELHNTTSLISYMMLYTLSYCLLADNSELQKFMWTELWSIDEAHRSRAHKNCKMLEEDDEQTVKRMLQRECATKYHSLTIISEGNVLIWLKIRIFSESTSSCKISTSQSQILYWRVIKRTSLISAHFVVALDSDLLSACINDIAHGK